MKIGSLFSGYGGLEMGVQSILGGSVAWHSEIDPGACKILAHHYPGVPNLGDITSVDWTQVEPVDVLTGGSPCQDVSAAGKRAGMRAGTRSALPDLCGRRTRVSSAGTRPCSRRPFRAGVRCAMGRSTSFRRRRPSRTVPRLRRRLACCRRQWWQTATGLPATTRGQSDADRGTAADTDRLGHERGRRTRVGRPGSADRSVTAADADRDGLVGQPGASTGRDTVRADQWDDADRCGYATTADGASNPGRLGDGDGLPAVEWGPFAQAIHRWERLTRPAPAPTELSAKGSPRLSPAFVEWLMGLPAGWVTDVPGITRNEQLKALGNGVVPQQAAAALRLLLPHRLIESAA